MDRRTRLVAGFIFVAVVAGGAFLISPKWMLERLGWLAANPLRLGLALVVLALLRPLVAWPVTLIAVIAGYGWGLWGFPPALVLMVVSCTPPYLLARRSKDDGQFSDVGEKATEVAGDFRSVVAGRFFPAPSDIVSAGAGLAGVPTRTYLVATGVGEVPWAFAGVVAGQSIGRVMKEGLSAVASPQLIVATAVVAALLLAGPVYRYATGDQDADVKDLLT